MSNASVKKSGPFRSKAFGWLVSLGVLGCLIALVIGTAKTPQAAAPQAAAASGTVSPKLLDQGPASAPVRAGVGSKTAMSFERSNVQTLTKAQAAARGSKANVVASRSLARPSAGKLYAPLEAVLPSSPFGLRTNPLNGEPGEFHWGQDFAASCGTRVYAADAGVVRAVGWHLWGGGNRVEIDHGNGLITTYNHLQGIGVQKGEPVRVGQVIAEVGTTGSSTGCHLHFETVVNGVHADPAKFTLLPTRQVDPLDEIQMVSYAPGAKDGQDSRGSRGEASGRPDWAVPVAAEPSRPVAGGAHESPRGPGASRPGASQGSKPSAPGKPVDSGKPAGSGKPAAGNPSAGGAPAPQPAAPEAPAPKPAAPKPAAPAPRPAAPQPVAPKPVAPKPAPKPAAPKPAAPKPAPKPVAPKPVQPAPVQPAPVSPQPVPGILDPVTAVVGGLFGGLFG